MINKIQKLEQHKFNIIFAMHNLLKLYMILENNQGK